jgi:hypothetical protein
MTAMKEPRRLKSALTPVPNAKRHSAGSGTNPALLATANVINATNVINVIILACTNKIAKNK